MKKTAIFLALMTALCLLLSGCAAPREAAVPQTAGTPRPAAQEAVAEDVLSALTAEEREQFDAINEKLIISLKEKGVSAQRKGHKHSRKHGHKRHGHRH